MEGLEALCYLDDIAHGRKMEFDPHELKNIVEKELKEGEANKNASEILRIIFNAPFIIETLFNKKELGKSASDRYLWGTISEEEVRKVKEFFKDGKI